MAKKKIAEGANPLSAHKSLANNERVHREVQECADDLHVITEILAEGIGEMKELTAFPQHYGGVSAGIGWSCRRGGLDPSSGRPGFGSIRRTG
jgi:hypothetical protein